MLSLTVRDNAGAANTLSTSVTVSGPAPNQPPNVRFNYTCSARSCTFSDASSDSDGTIVAWSWSFGDGASSSAQNPAHTYATSGTYTVTLRVTDNGGATNTTSAAVTIANSPPMASFTKSCTELTCAFTDTSSDADGTIVLWSWSFGDGTGSTAQHPSHSYAGSGTYTVVLTITDNAGASATATGTVTVTAPITLTATAWRVNGKRQVRLAWTGASTSSVDVYRNGARIVTTANTGSYTDTVRNNGTYTYKVCNAGSLTCSPDAVVTF